jgi:glucose-6-phosphate isomerase
MGNIKISFSGAGIKLSDLSEGASALAPYAQELSEAVRKQDWSHPAASILLCSEKKYADQSIALAKKHSTASLLIVVGIGGSNLGSLAAIQAIKGEHHNLGGTKPNVLFADTCDPVSLSPISQAAKKELKAGKQVVINIISKSGGTTETVANFAALLSLIGKSKKLSIVATTDEGSALDAYARKTGWDVLSIPKNVGGRYSVFSNCGLFPLSLCGVKITELLEGAREMRGQCLSENFSANPAALAAYWLFAQNEMGRKNHVHFMFSNSLRASALWYSQLLAESSGKEKDLNGNKANAGITPIACVGSTDLHSMAQLFLGGPANKTYRFVGVAKPRHDATLPNSAEIKALAPELGGKRMSSVMNSLLGGTEAAFAQAGLPYMEVDIPVLDEKSLGALMQMEMMEVMYLCKLLNVNAFDQPSVEAYKKEAHKLLSSSEE